VTSKKDRIQKGSLENMYDQSYLGGSHNNAETRAANKHSRQNSSTNLISAVFFDL